jgi:hypothetical protein
VPQQNQTAGKLKYFLKVRRSGHCAPAAKDRLLNVGAFFGTSSANTSNGRKARFSARCPLVASGVLIRQTCNGRFSVALGE